MKIWKRNPEKKLNFHLPTGCIKLNCNLLYFVDNLKSSLIKGWTYYPWQGICGKKHWLKNAMLAYAKTCPIRTNFLFLLRNSLRLPRKNVSKITNFVLPPTLPLTNKILPWVEIPILKSAFFFLIFGNFLNGMWKFYSRWYNTMRGQIEHSSFSQFSSN